ncbi:pyridoxine 5'-phosphate synthase [Lishizhenia tianjinensis]|uniref:Pyridoxine 5'-phosphate synthase n=1 Tax=Lishizhenia tianjinensis TaxID=477690 RepID=A0A1I6ZY33_9FLAO|nr:pyridoxine 5'-phosphate synthase [Lishizhenia tianjinensis]SFT67557.1 pyridoxine 5'-phosphate synthase [Lishizhenia tianjinensis]
MATKLSVNVNKIATLRNARGGDVPNVVQVAKDCETFGADGITIHPRPDERHITTQDVYDLKKVVTTEYNIEGYPDERFLQLCKETLPEQATLVPDPPHVLTSNAGWDTIKQQDFLKEVIAKLKSWGIRTSIFIETDVELIEHAATTGVDRIELYTGPYAEEYAANKIEAVAPYVKAAQRAHDLGLGINAGHDLSLENLKFFKQSLVQLDEVSIGHALISDALYYGLENTVHMYKRLLD